MQDIKQVDLCLKYCHFIPKTCEEYIYPKPSADKIQLTKEQRAAASKKRLEKLKITKDTIQDNGGLLGSEDRVIDDDGSCMCVVVNKVESNDEDKLCVASSSDSDSEVKEK